MKIARFKVLACFRDRKADRGAPMLSDEAVQAMEETAASMEEASPFEDDIVALRKCLERVKGKNRSILMKRYGDGLSCRAIADVLGWNVNSVYVALTRVRNALEKCIRLQLSRE